MKQLDPVRLRERMDGDYGWGRAHGRRVRDELLKVLDANASGANFEVSLRGVVGVDVSFAAETLVAIALLCRGVRGFRITDVESAELAENIDAAAQRAAVPILAEVNGVARMLGPDASQGTEPVLELVIKSGRARTSDVAETLGISPSNASNKLKQLWRDGFLLRSEDIAASGGREFTYHLPS